MSKITDYELGNQVLHNIGDALYEIANDCKESHPEESKYFKEMGRGFVQYGQDMERSNNKEETKSIFRILCRFMVGG